jgi:hypothetical protein
LSTLRVFATPALAVASERRIVAGVSRLTTEIEQARGQNYLLAPAGVMQQRRRASDGDITKSEAAPIMETRKIVAILVADVVG